MSNFGIMFLALYTFCVYKTFAVDLAWGIYLYVLQYWLNPVDRWWYGGLPNVRWSLTIALCIMIAFIMRQGKYVKNRLFDVPQTKWYIMNAALMILISNWAVWPEVHSQFVQDHIKMLIFIFITYKGIDTPAKFEGVMWAMMVGGFYVGHETRKKGRNSDGRVEGTGPADSGGDGNCGAASLVTLIPILTYFVTRSYVFKEKWWRRIILFLFLAFVGQSIILINSRGSFIALILSSAYMGYFVFVNKKVTMKQRFQMVIIVLLGLGAFLAVADDAFWERMSSIGGSNEEGKGDSEGGGRKVFWAIGINEIAPAYPWGVGGRGFMYLSPIYVPPELMPRNAGMRAEHSLYVECLVERGYLGFFIWFNLIVCNFLFMRKIKRHLLKRGDLPTYFLAVAVESGFIAFLIASAFIDRLNTELLYWQPLFVACFGNIFMLKGQSMGGKKSK